MNNEKVNETKKCKYCQSGIPRKASVCPVCKKKQSNSGCAVAILAIIVLCGACSALSKPLNEKVEENRQAESLAATEAMTEPTESEEEYRASCEEYAYKDVLRNPEQYIGKRVKVTVKISSVHEASWLNDTKYYFANTKADFGWYGDRYGVFDYRVTQDPKLLEDDIITVYGEIADPQYTSSLIISGSETFCINMKYIDFISE